MVSFLFLAESCTSGAVRLVNGSTSYEGRVEVCINNRWGTICADDNWDSLDTLVTCYQLGHDRIGT